MKRSSRAGVESSRNLKSNAVKTSNVTRVIANKPTLGALPGEESKSLTTGVGVQKKTAKPKVSKL